MPHIDDTNGERGRETMEERQSEVKLFGTWASAYCARVVLALKLKGIPYEYVEENLEKKSELLIHYNPVYKKVPVLVHNGQSVSESLVILEYIDDYWQNTPKILPEDPYERAKVRFWANFYDEKLLPVSYHVIMSKGKEQEKANENLSELLGVFEEGIEKDFPTKSPFFNGETLGFLGMVVGSNACNYLVFQEAAAVIIDPKKHPAFLSWVTALKDCPLMKETLPLHVKLVAKMKADTSLIPKV